MSMFTFAITTKGDVKIEKAPAPGASAPKWQVPRIANDPIPCDLRHPGNCRRAGTGPPSLASGDSAISSKVLAPSL